MEKTQADVLGSGVHHVVLVHSPAPVLPEESQVAAHTWGSKDTVHQCQVKQQWGWGRTKEGISGWEERQNGSRGGRISITCMRPYPISLPLGSASIK